MMLSPLPLLVTMLLAGLPAEELPVGSWPLYTTSSFTARMPSEPKVSGTPDDTTYLVRNGDSTYYVKSMLLPRSLASLPPAALLETLRDGSVEALGESGGARLLRSETSESAGRPCLTYLAEATPKGFPRTKVLVRLVLAGTRVFMITHSGPTQGFVESRAAEFVRSLVLAEPRPGGNGK